MLCLEEPLLLKPQSVCRMLCAAEDEASKELSFPHKAVLMGHCRRPYGYMQPSVIKQQATQELYVQGNVQTVPELKGKHRDSSALCNLPFVSGSACSTADCVVWADPEWPINAIWHQESKATTKTISTKKPQKTNQSNNPLSPPPRKKNPKQPVPIL